jgi:hypothetical protein
MTSSEDDEAHSVPSYMLPKGTNLDSMQKKKLKKRLRAICTEMPIYMCVMKKTHVSGRSQVVVSFFFLVTGFVLHFKCTSLGEQVV